MTDLEPDWPDFPPLTAYADEAHAFTDQPEVRADTGGLREVPFTPEGPQPLLRPLPLGLPYPVEALGPLKDAVEAVQGMTQAPVAIPAQSALAVASLAVMGFANVETLGGPRPTSLFCLTIAQSGERKSSCDALFMAPLRDHERAQGETYRRDLAAWKNDAALWKADHAAIMAKAKPTNAENRTASKADLLALGPEPSPPPSPHRIVTEPTIEGLARKFSEGHPALGLFSDEGGQFLGGYAMNPDNRQKTLAALNRLWQGDGMERTRGGDGSKDLPGRRLAMNLMVQPGVARTFMADPMATDTGFLPRFLICEPQSTIGFRRYAQTQPDNGALAAFADWLRAVLATPLPVNPDTRELVPRVLPLSAQARELLIEFHDTIEAAQAPGGDLSGVTGYASKIAEQACRIAGVMTLWRDPHAKEVAATDMVNGIELAQFYLSEAVRLANGAKVSEGTARAEALRLWLIEKWPDRDITLSDILQRCPKVALRERTEAKKAVQMLVEAGWLVALPPQTMVRGTARREAWRIVKGARDVV